MSDSLPHDMQTARRRRRLALNLLGIDDPAQADPATVRRHYRRRAARLHPDHRPDDPAAQRDFQLLQNAFDFFLHGDRGQDLEPIAEEEERDAYGYLRNAAGYRYNLTRKYGGGLWANEDPQAYQPPPRRSCI